MLSDVLADLGRPLPTFRSALPLATIRLSKLSGPLLDHLLDGNSFNSLIEPHLFSFLRFSIKILSFTLILPILQVHARFDVTIDMNKTRLTTPIGCCVFTCCQRPGLISNIA